MYPVYLQEKWALKVESCHLFPDQDYLRINLIDPVRKVKKK